MLFNLSELKFEDGKLTRVQVSRIGDKMKHKLYGEITITTDDHKKMVENFNKNARGLSEDGKPILQFDYKHEDGEIAAGWIHSLILSDDGEKLYADTRFTPSATKKIQDGEFKFSSPTIVRDFVNTKTNEKFEIVLKGVALTNIPFLHDMEAITALDEDGKKKAMEYLNKLELQDMGTMEGILRAISDLSPEEQTEIALKISSKLKTKVGVEKMTTDEKHEKMTQPTENEIKLTEENEKLKKEVELSEREKDFTILLTEGKVVPAQKEAYMSGDMKKFAEQAEHVNLDERGSGTTPDDKINDGNAAENKLIELAETYAKERGVTFEFAMSEVMLDEANAAIVKLVE
jgi:phage I-like protein